MDDIATSRLLDIIHYAKTAVKLVGDMSSEEFEADLRTSLAVSRCVEIIGEAATNLDSIIKEKTANDIPWKDIIGTRIVLAHAYMRIDTGTIYKIVKNDLPELVKQIDKLLEEKNDHDT